MMCLSHIYVSSEVMGRKSGLLLFGSVLPDIATTSKGELGRDEIHYSPGKFYDFVLKNYPNLRDLAIGVRLHSNVGGGADFYCDDTETGYAKKEGKKIADGVTRLLGIRDNQANLILAHNIVEAAVDLNLCETRPSLCEDYRNCLSLAQSDEVIDCLSSYLGKERGSISRELENFTQALNPDFFLSNRAILAGIAIPLIRLRFGKEMEGENEIETAVAMIERTREMVKGTYQAYLDETVEKMKIDFKDII